MDNNQMEEEEVGGEVMEESEGELSSDHGGEDEKEEEEKGLLSGRKRKRKTSTHHRRKLRSKYESVDDFNPEARTAQSEELERIRRLKLQQTLAGEADYKEAEEGEEGRAPEERRKSEEGAARRESSSVEVEVVDLTEMVEEEQTSSEVEAIVIDSGSESEDDHTSKSGTSQPGSTSRRTEIDKLNRKYDWAEPSLDGRVLVNVGHGSEEDDIFLAPQIARVAKPHQIGGIRFLYDNIVESQSRFNTSTGFGCILAHSMGLGKTLQVIAFIDIFLRHTPARHVLCVVPVNTLQNWIAEFDCWLPIHPGEKGVVEFKTTSRPTSRHGSPLETPENKVLSGSPLHPDTDTQLSVPTSGCTSSSSSLRAASPMEGSTLKTPSPSPAPVAPVLPNQGLLLSSPLVSPSTQPNLQGDTVAEHAAAGDVPVTGQIPYSKGSENTTPDTNYRRFKLFMLSEGVRTMDARLKVISQWRKEGGVLLMGYEMYRLLALSVPSLGGNKMAVKRRKSAKNQQVNHERATIDLEETEKEMDALIAVQQALCRPGPDLVICDEGHRIKNDGTNISQALKKIRTRRRIVMTGYPVQNNLQEYWCMVDFVRPNYLGTKHEFADLFERPITNGQCVDSTAADVRIMRFRSHVLHALLEGFVLRRGHEILNLTLPPKFEHMLYLRPSAAQATLYNYNIEQMQGMTASMNAGPLRAFAVCSKIWNHPDIYYTEAVAQDSNRTSPTLWLDEAGLPKLLLSKTEPGSMCKIDWPSTALPNYQTGLLSNSPKMAVMMELINRSVMLGDRVLVFSQSLPTLSYVEKLLSQSPIPVPNSTSPDGTVQLSDSKWIKGRNFCRLDGSTGSMERDRLINYFNSAANTECWVFLLSTRAGCLGVNLVGANRVIVLDVSWNPCYDTQAVCRVYRYGQVKPVFIYRLVCDGTMERKIYDRQVSKQGMSDRVVDELHPERHFTVNDIITLIAKLAPLSAPPDHYALSEFHFSDPVLAEVCKTHGHLLTKLPFKHESLLVSTDERLTEIEKYYALKGFQQDWKAIRSAPGQIYRTQQAARPQQSLMPRLPATTTTVPRTVPAVTTQVVTNLQRMPTARVDPSNLLFPPATASQRREGGSDMEVICLDSDSDEEGSSIERSNQVSSTGSGARESLSAGTASQATQIIGGVSQSVGGAQKGSSPPVVVVQQQGVLPSSMNARASPLQPPSSLSPARAQATIGSTGITSPFLTTSPALAATIANILASAKGSTIRVGDVVATPTGTTNCPPSSVSLSSFATASSEKPSDPGARATHQAAALPPSIADLVQYSQQLSKLNHMRPQQGTESPAASHQSSSQQQTRSLVDPLGTTPRLLTLQPQTVSSNLQRMTTDLHAQATGRSLPPTSAHGVSSAPTAQPPTPIPLLSPMVARLPFTSASSPTAPTLSSIAAPPLSSIPTHMPTLVPLPSNPSPLPATARKTAVVPPYFAASPTGNTPSGQSTLSRPQFPQSSNGSTGHSRASIAPESKTPMVVPSADEGETKPIARNCESIVLGD